MQRSRLRFLFFSDLLFLIIPGTFNQDFFPDKDSVQLFNYAECNTEKSIEQKSNWGWIHSYLRWHFCMSTVLLVFWGNCSYFQNPGDALKLQRAVYQPNTIVCCCCQKTIVEEEMICNNDCIEEKSVAVRQEASNPLRISNTCWPSLMKSRHVNSR